MKVKQISKPGGDCRDCVFYTPRKRTDCRELTSGLTCGNFMKPDHMPWVEAADGTHSWNQRKKTLRKLRKAQR